MTRGHKPPSERQLRVGEELRHSLAMILERGEIRDPDVAAAPITVTEVRVSPDLRNATAFVTPLGGGDPTAMLAGLKRVKSYLRHEMAKKLTLRHVPDLSFQPDTSFDVASRIDALLHDPRVRRDIDAGHLAEDEDRRSIDAPEGADDGE